MLSPYLLHPPPPITTRSTYLGKGLATAFVLALIPAGKLATLGAGADNIHGSRSEGEDVDGSLRWTRFKRPRGRSLWRHLCSSNVDEQE